MHLLGTYGHIYTNYEVSMSNPVARRGVHRRCGMTTYKARLYKALVDKPNELLQVTLLYI